MLYKTLSVILVAAAIVFFFVTFSGGFSKGLETIRGIISNQHASTFLFFSLGVALLILLGANIARDGLTIKNFLFIP